MVTGLWVNDYTYQMYDARTHRHRRVVVFARDGGLSEPEEVADIVAEYKERFAAELRETPNWQPMPREQQHELGPHLNEIKETKRRYRETNNHRYAPGLGGQLHA